MENPLPVPLLVVVYAQDLERVAEFYKRTLSRPVIEHDPDFIVVGDVGLEVAIVRVSEASAKGMSVSAPHRVRMDTALKASFLVGDLDHMHNEAMATGGGTNPVSAAWEWRGQLHLDGHDPEGNVVQFRKRV